MVVPSTLFLLPVLGSLGQVTASVLLGRQAAPAVTKFATVYADGDASRPRYAMSGFEMRVDVAHTAWGFCATNNPNQCDLADSCVDNAACSTGCGFGSRVLKTWTW